MAEGKKEIYFIEALKVHRLPVQGDSRLSLEKYQSTDMQLVQLEQKTSRNINTSDSGASYSTLDYITLV